MKIYDDPDAKAFDYGKAIRVDVLKEILTKLDDDDLLTTSTFLNTGNLAIVRVDNLTNTKPVVVLQKGWIDLLHDELNLRYS